MGAGTGVTGLALLKHTEVAKVIFTDYLRPILNLIRENIALQEDTGQTESRVELVDWAREETWQLILDPETTPTIDRAFATDVIYNSSCFDQLARLLRAIKDRHPNCIINVVIPQDRDKGAEFVGHM